MVLSGELAWFSFLLLIKRSYYFQEHPEAWTFLHSVSNEVSSFVESFGALCELPFPWEESLSQCSDQRQPLVFLICFSWCGTSALCVIWGRDNQDPHMFSLPCLHSVSRHCIEEGCPQTLSHTHQEFSCFSFGAGGNEKCWWPALLVRYHTPWSGAEGRGTPIFLAIPTPGGVLSSRPGGHLGKSPQTLIILTKF